MATYEQVRSEQLLKNNSKIARHFANTKYNPNYETVVMLPGGLASQLERSKGRYRSNQTSNFEVYENLWIDLGIIFKKDARKLEITNQGHDKNDHIIIPNGALESFAESPYDETEKFFLNNKFNYLAYGYDWRRPITESADLLYDFLKKFKLEVTKKFGKTRNPLPKTTLLCHSMGGLVAKLFLNKVFDKNTKTKDVEKWIKMVITVATPFYGTSNHIHRYYRGEDLLNTIYGTDTICRLAGTMPGAYILMFLDSTSFKKYNEVIDKPELKGYPFVEMVDGLTPIDPYSKKSFSRYPRWINTRYLTVSRTIRAKIDKLIPNAVINKVFHIRSGGDKKTDVKLLWDNIDGVKYDPFIWDRDNLPFPLKGQKGEGDGTVPFWSGRLAQTPDNHIYNLLRASNHSSLLEHIETLKAVKFIINKSKIPTKIKFDTKEIKVPQLATKKAVETFLNGVRSNQFRLEDKQAIDPKIWRRIMRDVL